MKKITQARSKKNGINFYSYTMPGLVLNAFVDDDGKVQTMIMPQIVTDFVDVFTDEDNVFRKPLVHPGFVLFVKASLIITLTVLFRNVYLSLAAMYICLFFSSWCRVLRSAIKFKLGSRQDVSRFHAAEHMVINAYCHLRVFQH